MKNHPVGDFCCKVILRVAKPVISQYNIESTTSGVWPLK